MYGALDLSQPLNTDHPQAQGLVMMFLAHPELMHGGVRWVDVVGKYVGTITSTAWPATLISGPGMGTARSGGAGEMRFDGTNDYVALSAPAAANFAAPATLCGWVNTLADTAQTLWGLTDNTATVDNTVSVFIGNAVTGNLTNELITVNRKIATVTTYILGYTTATRTELIDGKWHHIAITYNGTVVAIYLDGISKTVTVGTGSNNGAFGGITTVTNLDIGARHANGPGAFMNGALDDVRLYNRALSPLEILDVIQESALGNPALLNWDETEADADWWVREAGTKAPALYHRPLRVWRRAS